MYQAELVGEDIKRREIKKAEEILLGIKEELHRQYQEKEASIVKRYENSEEDLTHRIWRENEQTIDSILKNVGSYFNESYYRLSKIESDRERNKVVKRDLENIVTAVRSNSDPNINSEIMSTPINPLRSYKEADFWKKWAWALGLGSLVVAFVFIFPNYLSTIKDTSVEQLKEMNQGSEQFVDKIKEERALSYYQPEQNLRYHSTYFENILYLKKYLETKRDDSVQQEWVTELNRFLVDFLFLSDRLIVNFIPAENHSIDEISEIREKIDPKNLKESLKKAKLKSQRFENDLVKLLGSLY